jgi:hypothetical protein
MTDAPTDIDQSSPKQSRRRYGWWLVFALFVLLFAVGLPYLIRYHRQMALIERIESAGGAVRTEQVGPEWLRIFLDEDRMRGFDNVVVIYDPSPMVDDDWMADIGRLTSLEELHISNTQVTDAGLVYLKDLKKLRMLSVDYSKVTEAGLVHLKEHANLEVLLLNNTRVTDAGLAHLKGLNNLSSLILINTQVSKAGVNELQAALPDCRIVWSNE